MRITVAAAAFDPYATGGVRQARAACETARRQGAELIVLPGVRWSREEILRLSASQAGLLICAGVEPGGGLIAQEGAVLHDQRALFSRNPADELIIFEHNGLGMALLAGRDALAPQAARMAGIMNAAIVLCPVDSVREEGPWAQVQQNGLFCAEAPADGEARVLCPLCAAHPDGVMARGRPGSMAIVQLEAKDWIRARISYDPLSLLNREFAASMPIQAPPEQEAPRSIKVAAVQRTLDFEGGSKRLIERMEAMCERAQEQKCQMIAFPEFHWLDALGDIPGVAGRAGKAGRTPLYLEERDEPAVRAFFPEVAPYQTLPLYGHALLGLTAGRIRRLALRETVRLARKYGLIVHGGTFWEKEKKKRYNTAVIAYPDGEAVLQRKLCLTAQERALGFSPGEDLSVFPVGGAQACAPVCMDATYYEPFYAARRVGCDLSIVPIFNAEAYYEPAARRGSWARAREAGLFIVTPALTGYFLGQRYTGYAGIYSPLGQEWQSREPQGDELVVGELDFGALYRLREPLPLNYALERALAARLSAK